MPDARPTVTNDTGQPVKYVPIAEFREAGFLMELNRLFLHPLGMALEVVQELDDEGNPTGVERLGGIWDYRDDPEGILYGEGQLNVMDLVKSANIVELWNQRKTARQAALGFVIQPIMKLPDPVNAST